MTDYYIRTSGDDSDSGLTPALAWASFTKAFDTIAAGDTVYIGPGTYVHSETARAAFGGTSGSPKVFQGDPHGIQTGDEPGIVAMIGRGDDFAGQRYDNLIEWTGDTKFWEFHDIVFLGSAMTNVDDMIFLGSNTGAFGMDGIVFEDCMFYNKGTGRYSGDLLVLNYGDGDTPVGNGIRITRCNFDGRILVLCDDQAVATFDIDLILDSCVFSGGGRLVVAPNSGTFSIGGIKIRNCSNVANSANYLYGVVSPSNIHGTNSITAYGIVNEANGPAINTTTSDADSILANYATAIQHESETVDNHDAVGNGVIGIGVMNPRSAFWGYEANYVYDKYYGTKPYLEFEPVEIFGIKNPAIGGADPDEFPTLDYYGRPFQANHANSRVAVGFYNGDYATAPYNDVLYTWQDPNTAWTGEDTINQGIGDFALCSVAGSISTNFLHIEKPSVRIDTNQIIHRVFVRPYLNLLTGSPDINFNFYTLAEAENLGGFTIANDGSTSAHWFDMQEVPAPAGGWTKTHVENLECRMWMTTGTALRVSILAVYLETGQVDAGAVSSQGPREVETTVVNTGSNAIKFNKAGTYQTTIPVKANTGVTISVFARKDSNYTGTGPKLEVFNIPDGIAEQTATHTAAADTWEELTVIFRPTRNGFVTVRLLSQDTSDDGSSYFDTLTWDNASVPFYTLDGISDITVALSVRRLLTSYTGDLIRLRRDSDNAESDFGYDANGNLDTAAITTFLTGTTGYFTTMYDQSGTANDAVQATASTQPRYNATSINGKPAGETFDANNRYMNYGLTWPVTSLLIAVLQVVGTGTINLIGNVNAVSPTFRFNHTIDKPLMFLGTQNWQYYVADTTYRDGSPHAHSVWCPGTGQDDVDNVLLWEDGIARTKDNKTKTAAQQTFVNSGFRSNPNNSEVGSIPEYIIFGGLLSVADHNQVGESMDDYFGVTWTPVT